MKKIFTLLFMFLCMASISLAQEAPSDTVWNKGGIFSLNFSNTGVSNNWQAGGVDTRALIGLGTVFADYQSGKSSWENTLNLAYGLVNQGDTLSESVTRKNEDRIDFTSKYGYNFNEKLALAGLLNFRTQFAPGFEFDGKGNAVGDAISKAFNPAYLNFGLGLDWKPVEGFSIYYSPVNSKLTIVTDETLRSRYMPPGEDENTVRYELGSYLNTKYEKAFNDKFKLQTKADFFLNYLAENPAVDVNWETLLTLQATEWFAVTFFTHLIYDADIVEDGVPVGTQFKNVLGLGLTRSVGGTRE